MLFLLIKYRRSCIPSVFFFSYEYAPGRVVFEIFNLVEGTKLNPSPVQPRLVGYVYYMYVN